MNRGSYSRERIDEDISICLNCDRERCTGQCKRIVKSRKEISDARKENRRLQAGRGSGAAGRCVILRPHGDPDCSHT